MADVLAASAPYAAGYGAARYGGVPSTTGGGIPGAGAFAGAVRQVPEKVARFQAANPRFFPALTALTLGAGVYNEMMDDDPVGRNLVQSAGVIGGGLAGQKLGMMLGGTIGTALLPGIGTAVGAGLGSLAGGDLGTMFGSQVGSQAMGGIYDAITGDSDESRAEKKYLRQQRAVTKADAERLQTLGPIADKIAQMADARAINVARRNAEIAQDMNLFNRMNASSLNMQQNAAQQQALLMQGLL